MKHYPFVRAFVTGLILLLFASCIQEGSVKDDTTGKVVPPEQVLLSFETRYPDATEVLWSVEEGYYVADFNLSSQVACAWFGTNGEWTLGKIPKSYHGEIEPVVSEAFSHTTYADWEVKEAYVLNRKVLVPVYTISVTNSHIFSNLYFTQYGDFIKVIDDVHQRTDAPINIPASLLNAVDRLFDEVEIVDVTVVDVINSEISVGMIKDATYLTAIFNKNYAWIVNFWNLTPQTVPPVVWEGYKASPYADLALSRIRAMQNATATTYLFYLIRNNKTMIAEFNSSGRLTTVISRNHAMAKYLLTR
jgi:hypothetical protein